MKRIFLFISLLFAALCISSCGDDSADDVMASGGNGGDVNNTSIVGTWLSIDGEDAYVFKIDGTGIGCEHVDETEQDEWTFTYTYSKDGTITMVYDEGIEYEGGDDKDIFRNVVIKGEELYCDDEDGDRLTFVRQETPIPVLSVWSDVLEDSYPTDVRTFYVGSTGARYSLNVKCYYLWHTSCPDVLVPSVTKTSDNIISNYSLIVGGDVSLLYFTVNTSTEFSDRTSHFTISGSDGHNVQLLSADIDILQQAKEATFEVTGPSTISSAGGQVTFYVYNKDQASVIAYYPPGQGGQFTSLTTKKYSGGSDYTFTVTVPAYYTSSERSFEYRFTKDDGCSIIKEIVQEAGNGESGGNTGGGSTNEFITGQVEATAHVIGPGLAYDREAQFYDGRTCTIDYYYYPSTGRYYVFGGPYCSHPEANGGKGLRFDAVKGYNNICVYYGVYFDKSKIPYIKYNWDVYLRFYLP